MSLNITTVAPHGEFGGVDILHRFDWPKLARHLLDFAGSFQVHFCPAEDGETIGVKTVLRCQPKRSPS